MRNPVRHRLARSTLAGVCLALGASALGAQTGTIVGRVTDARTNGPLAQATVLVEGTRLGASAGQDGAYRIANVPAGTRTVVARRIGHASIRKTVTVTAGGEASADFALEQTTVALDEVVVTGTAGGELRRSIGNAVSRIDASDELAKSAATNLTS